jgi:hypothetical protein
MIFRLREFFLFVALLLVNQAGFGGKTRWTCSIGSSTYQNAALLPNPANDAAAVAQERWFRFGRFTPRSSGS